MVNQCYECKKRYAGCHSSCEEYKRFKAENETRKRNNDVEQYVIDRTIKLRDKYVERKKSKRMRNRKRR